MVVLKYQKEMNYQLPPNALNRRLFSSWERITWNFSVCSKWKLRGADSMSPYRKEDLTGKIQ